MIIGEKICLGPLLSADAPAVFNWLNSRPLVTLNGPYRPTDQMKFEGWYASLGNDPGRVMFAIRKQGDLRLLGYVQVINIQPVFRTAEIGILIANEADRGQGYGTEAVGLALDHCWRDLNLHRATLFIFGDNPRALAAYAKVGFVEEGRMREAAYVDGRHVDITVMGALRPPEPAGR
jgi:RimJ/RimL family protein N-acetyltransferase